MDLPPLEDLPWVKDGRRWRATWGDLVLTLHPPGWAEAPADFRDVHYMGEQGTALVVQRILEAALDPGASDPLVDVVCTGDTEFTVDSGGRTYEAERSATWGELPDWVREALTTGKGVSWHANPWFEVFVRGELADVGVFGGLQAAVEAGLDAAGEQ